jgi:GH24 family phage-related lysozyme (muramidase)
MAADEEPTTREQLKAELEAYRRDGAPPAWVASALHSLLEAHVDERDLPAARAVLGEFSALRGDAAAAAFEGLAAARLARAESNPQRAAWLALGAVRASRGLGLEPILPLALVELAAASEALERREDARAARAEAAAVFERLGEAANAASCLASLHLLVPDEEQPELLQRALRLAERGGLAHVTAWVWLAQGRRHRRRSEYLPARRAFERALALSRDAGGKDLGVGLVELAWLECEAFHNDDALRLADEALALAKTPRDRAWALRARVEALGQLHRHRDARVDALAAAREFLEDGDAPSAAEARTRARVEALLIALHRLPTWIFEPGDMSSLDANKQPLRLGRVVVFAAVLSLSLALLWLAGWGALSVRATGLAPRSGLLLVGLLPTVVLYAAVGLLVRDSHRARRARAAARDAGGDEAQT